ncbi:MAG: SDR family NAD(P)-dependent oxidoreductase [Spirochaetaceae bacterium]|jgi:sorbitol-6-phosphate 2-dehydrogenase|nr:SDR family NAD(P)-dependent oxidoreductase [Spirochaetaceae bacterium]
MISILAPLVRGICIHAAKAPRIVITGQGPEPQNALTVDLDSAFKKDNSGAEIFHEEEAAKILNEAYAAWEFEITPSGAERSEAECAETVNKQPSSIVLKRGAKTLGIFWIDRDIDAARNRQKNGDDALLEERSGRKPGGEFFSPDLSAANRSCVVKNRVAVVTGGAQGFGEQISLGLAASGALVFIADLNLKGAEALAGKINDSLGRTAAIPVQADITSETSMEALFAFVAEQAGGLDLCICNAGVLQAGSVMEQKLESFKFTTEVNYVGYFITAKYASRILRLQHLTALQWKTDIIQINSKSGLEGSNKNGAYAGSKFGGLGLTASFALELVEYNIKVNSICPGNFFDGPLWADPEKGLFVQYLRAGKVSGARTVADVKAYYEDRVPMKRGCEGPDVMRAIYYVVEQKYETGQAVPVTGGQVMLH